MCARLVTSQSTGKDGSAHVQADTHEQKLAQSLIALERNFWLNTKKNILPLFFLSTHTQARLFAYLVLSWCAFFRIHKTFDHTLGGRVYQVLECNFEWILSSLVRFWPLPLSCTPVSRADARQLPMNTWTVVFLEEL